MILARRKLTRASDHYDNGNVRFRGANVDGKMHGLWEFFRRDGSLMRSGSFDHGAQIGAWRTYDRTGRVLKETDFSRGQSRAPASAGSDGPAPRSRTRGR